MKILALQLDIAWEDRTANFTKVERLLEEAKPEPNTLVVLPEMFATGFSMSPEASEPENGPTRAFLSRLAAQYQLTLVGGMAERDRNVAYVFNQHGKPFIRYVKQRPFRAGGEIYRAGSSSINFDWHGINVSPFICYDLRFPEIFRDIAAENRPELYVVIASWPSARAHHWVRLLQARAIENQAYVLGVNRCGTDPFFTFPGRTMLVDWHGEIVADAGSEEGTLSASLELPALREYRSQLRFLDDLAQANNEDLFQEDARKWTSDDDFFDGTITDRHREHLWESLLPKTYSLPETLYPLDSPPPERHIDTRPWLNNLRHLTAFFAEIPADVELIPFDGDMIGNSHCLKGQRKNATQTDYYVFYQPYEYKRFWLVDGSPKDFLWRWFNPRTGEWHDTEPEWGQTSNDWATLLTRIPKDQEG